MPTKLGLYTFQMHDKSVFPLPLYYANLQMHFTNHSAATVSYPDASVYSWIFHDSVPKSTFRLHYSIHSSSFRFTNSFPQFKQSASKSVNAPAVKLTITAYLMPLRLPP